MADAAVVGHGLSRPELTANPRLTRHFVQDLNADPVLPLEMRGFDAATPCVSVQHLQRPVAMLAEVLRPGAPVVVSISNRRFPTEAAAIWTALGADDRGRLAELYLRRAGFSYIKRRTPLPKGGRSDPLTAIIGRAPEVMQDGTGADPAV